MLLSRRRDAYWHMKRNMSEVLQKGCDWEEESRKSEGHALVSKSNVITEMELRALRKPDFGEFILCTAVSLRKLLT